MVSPCGLWRKCDITGQWTSQLTVRCTQLLCLPDDWTLGPTVVGSISLTG